METAFLQLVLSVSQLLHDDWQGGQDPGVRASTNKNGPLQTTAFRQQEDAMKPWETDASLR